MKHTASRTLASLGLCAVLFVLEPAATRAAPEAQRGLRLEIEAPDVEARDIVARIRSRLSSAGLVITESPRVPVVRGRSVCTSRDQSRVSPYGARTFTMHSIELELQDLHIQDAIGNQIAALGTFRGFEQNEIVGRATAGAVAAIVAELDQSGFFRRAVDAAQPVPPPVKTAAQIAPAPAVPNPVPAETDKAPADVAAAPRAPENEKQPTRPDHSSSAPDMTGAVQVFDAPSDSDTGTAPVRVVPGEVTTIVKTPGQEAWKPEVSAAGVSGSGKPCTCIVIDATALDTVPRLRLQHVYSEDDSVVFGPVQNTGYNPLVYFETVEAMRRSEFAADADRPLTIRATAVNPQDHLIISDADAKRMRAANRAASGKIFNDCRIFVITGHTGIP